MIWFLIFLAIIGVFGHAIGGFVRIMLLSFLSPFIFAAVVFIIGKLYHLD